MSGCGHKGRMWGLQRNNDWGRERTWEIKESKINNIVEHPTTTTPLSYANPVKVLSSQRNTNYLPHDKLTCPSKSCCLNQTICRGQQLYQSCKQINCRDNFSKKASCSSRRSSFAQTFVEHCVDFEVAIYGYSWFRDWLASSPGRFFANITAGEKYGLVLIVCACALF